MKETVNVNIGSQAFTLDEDAYRVLRNYLEDIRSRLPEYDTETMGDIDHPICRAAARSYVPLRAESAALRRRGGRRDARPLGAVVAGV